MLYIFLGFFYFFFYDYGGFFDVVYNLIYFVSGDLVVVEEVKIVFSKVGLKLLLDENCGWDYGVFVFMFLVDFKGIVLIV